MTGPAARDGRTLLVVAKAPEPGRVKTRLVPSLTFAEAAELAAAALADTLDAAAACECDRVVVALDGARPTWFPSTLTVVAQRGADFTERLADAWTYAGRGPSARTVQIGMDTPQVQAADLDAAFLAVESPRADTALGLAVDGGWWVLAMRGADPGVFAGVPMSTRHTGAAQLAALEARGRTVALLPTLRDVDEIADVPKVAAAAPDTRFAGLAHSLGLTRTDRSSV